MVLTGRYIIEHLRYRWNAEILLFLVVYNLRLKSNLKKIVNNLHNDYWQRELFQIHTTNEATLQEVEASALVLKQAHNQQQKIQALGKNDTGTESGI